MGSRLGQLMEWSNQRTSSSASTSPSNTESLASSKEVIETWIVLELCNMGSLQVKRLLLREELILR